MLVSKLPAIYMPAPLACLKESQRKPSTRASGHKTLCSPLSACFAFSLYLSTAMPCIGEEEKGRSSPYQNLGNICCSYTLRVLRFIREQKRPETYIDVSLIWMAECFRENPVTYNRVLGMARERPRGISSLESMYLCLPHLGWPCQTEISKWFWTLAYM